MTRTDFWGLLILVSVFVIGFTIKVDIAKWTKKQQETIAVYTVEDIYYIAGTRVWTASGEIDQLFTSRPEAITFYENITKDIALKTIMVLDSITGFQEEPFH